jgi:uncharacterized protein (DUF4213/DUF364 family)
MALIQKIIDSIPDDSPVRDVRICVHATIVESLRVGLCGHSRADQAYEVIKRQDVVANHGRLREFTARNLAKYALSKLPIEASVGVASISSLLDVDWTKVHVQRTSDVLIERSRGKKVTMVGHFPFTERIKKEASHLDELGIEPDSGDIPVSELSCVLPGTDVAIISSSTIVNQSIEQLLNLTQNAPFVAIAGPSTILSPVFFRYGVDVLLGSLIDNVESVLRHLSEGSSLKHLPGLIDVAMYSKDYLGV